MSPRTEPQKPWHLDVAQMKVRPTPGRPNCLRIFAFIDKTDGIFVDVPLPSAEEQFDVTDPAELFSHVLENALNTLIWIYQNPDEAVADATIDASAAALILKMKAAQ